MGDICDTHAPNPFNVEISTPSSYPITACSAHSIDHFPGGGSYKNTISVKGSKVNCNKMKYASILYLSIYFPLSMSFILSYAFVLLFSVLSFLLEELN